ncbi:MAG: hypothetical protein JEY96_14860 [Bacteroidales bacterium]|nr:hypothetical protein [Bacteroidales bacterium]
MKLYTETEIKAEVDNPEFQVKIPAFSGRNYPIEYLNSREFELLTYFLFKKEISQGMYSDEFDAVRLMKGIADKGRDLLLQFENKNTGVIQCKRYESLINKPQLAREIIKFVLHAIQDKSLINNSEKFTYYFIALNGFNDRAQNLLNDLKSILNEEKIESWTEEVIEENEGIKIKSFKTVETELNDIFNKIKVEPITGHDLDQKLKNSKEIIPMFFEVEKVASEEMLRQVLSEFVGFKNDEDLEKLRNRLQNVPQEKRMYFGLFNIYGFDLSFYKKISRDKKLIVNIAEIRNELNRRFVDFLKETIEKYQIIFISGLKELSPFTKQVVVPYLFNKYALLYNQQEMGGFMAKIVENKKDSQLFKYQTIEEHKQHYLEIGQLVLNDDYSSFVGDNELLELKKNLTKWIHAGFESIQEMSDRFDEDMKVLMPIIETIENYIRNIMPTNPTIIIDNSGLGETEEDFIELLKKVNKLE